MRVSVADIKPGMVLLEPAENHRGQILLPVGAAVGEKHVRILKTWGVCSIEVEDPEAPASAPGAGSNEEVARIEARFRRVGDDPLLKQIMAVLARHAAVDS